MINVTRQLLTAHSPQQIETNFKVYFLVSGVNKQRFMNSIL
jgi:hypothetical protein